ncbi:MAG: thymidylate synthase [Lachnospiraceae bacterium]|nr:thymidylate synthase [Lachnospiraceae bacterium]
MSLADQIYINNYNMMLKNGYWTVDDSLQWPDGEKVNVWNAFGIVNRYDLQKEFPILTLRKINLFKAIDEILWIWQKKSNNIADLGNHTWDRMADENGNIGKAYGYQLGVKHKYPEGEFDQVDRLLYELKHNPSSRRMYANMYNHSDLYESQIYPCAYSLTLGVEHGKLNGILNQRSQEMLVSNSWNVCQYAVLLTMFAYSCGYEPGELLHVISTAIVYDRNLPVLKEMVGLRQFDAPVFKVKKDIDFYEYDRDSFLLENYRFNNADFKIERPIRIAM